jgi:hypothetical protein
MDGCSRQDPAYRPATGRPPSRGRSYTAGRSGRLQAQLPVSAPPFPANRSTPGVPMPSATTKKQTAGDAYCPHCHLLIERKVGGNWPREPLRCPHCRLLVGSGRARPTPSAEPGARGSAAGVFAHEAKRARGATTASKEEVCRAIRAVADAVGSRPERLLMVDYQQRVSDQENLPALSEVFAAYGSWKRARRAAATSG